MAGTGTLGQQPMSLAQTLPKNTGGDGGVYNSGSVPVATTGQGLSSTGTGTAQTAQKSKSAAGREVVFRTGAVLVCAGLLGALLG